MKRMVLLGSLALAACVVLGSACAFSEDWPSLEKKMREAYGKHCSNVKDVTMVQKLTVVSDEGEVAFKNAIFMKGERFRAESDMTGMMGEGAPAMKTIVISDGAKMWIASPMGTMEVPADEGSKYRNDWFCGKYLPVKAEIVGSEAVGGIDCWKVKCLDKDARYAMIWIDKAKYNPIKVSGMEGGEETTALLSDFRKVLGDMEMPFRTEMYQGKKLVSTVIMEKIEFNKGLSDDLFDPSKAGGSKADANKPGLQDMLKKAKKAAEDEAKGTVKK